MTTGYGGHMDFCDADNAYLVDFTFARAQTHFGLSNSFGLSPTKQDLITQLSAVYSERDPRGARASCGARARRLMSEFRWAKVAERVHFGGAMELPVYSAEAVSPKRWDG